MFVGIMNPIVDLIIDCQILTFCFPNVGGKIVNVWEMVELGASKRD